MHPSQGEGSARSQRPGLLFRLGASTARPAGARPAGARPAGARPAGARPAVPARSLNTLESTPRPAVPARSLNTLESTPCSGSRPGPQHAGASWRPAPGSRIGLGRSDFLPLRKPTISSHSESRRGPGPGARVTYRTRTRTISSRSESRLRGPGPGAYSGPSSGRPAPYTSLRKALRHDPMACRYRV
jgi:hypothetical protein